MECGRLARQTHQIKMSADIQTTIVGWKSALFILLAGWKPALQLVTDRYIISGLEARTPPSTSSYALLQRYSDGDFTMPAFTGLLCI